ncbi:MAG: hypothetical protein ACXWW5_03710 [Actinomycetota bacterium]
MRSSQCVAPAARSAVVLVSIFCAMYFLPRTAHACSCAEPEPRDAIASHDAAFVGTLIDRREGGPDIPAWDDLRVDTFRFTVEHDIKENLGTEVEVVASSDGTSCGLEVPVGTRTGLFLTLSNDAWTSGLCSQVQPEKLLAAADPLPAPEGQGPIRLLVGGNFGEARVMALDARGRTLAYGYGEGDVYDIAVCPGGHRSVESVTKRRNGSLVVRDVASLAVIRRVPIVQTQFPSIYLVACLDERGDHLLAIDEVHPETRVHEVQGDDVTVVFAARAAWGAAVEDGVPYLVIDRTRFGSVDIETGRFEEITRLPAHTNSVRVSPDGRWVAATRFGDELPGDIVLISTEDGASTSTTLGASGDVARIQWLADDRLLFLPLGETIDRLTVFDVPSMDEIVGADGWHAYEAAVAGDVVYGFDGRLVAVRFGVDRSANVVREFDGQVHTLALVLGSLGADPSPPPPGGSEPNRVSGPTPSARDDRSSMGAGWAVLIGLGIGIAVTALRRGRSG